MPNAAAVPCVGDRKIPVGIRCRSCGRAMATVGELGRPLGRGLSPVAPRRWIGLRGSLRSDERDPPRTLPPGLLDQTGPLRSLGPRTAAPRNRRCCNSTVERSTVSGAPGADSDSRATSRDRWCAAVASPARPARRPCEAEKHVPDCGGRVLIPGSRGGGRRVCHGAPATVAQDLSAGGGRSGRAGDLARCAPGLAHRGASCHGVAGLVVNRAPPRASGPRAERRWIGQRRVDFPAPARSGRRAGRARGRLGWTPPPARGRKRAMAGGEDGGQVRRPERSRLPSAAAEGAPGRCVPGSTPRPRPSKDGGQVRRPERPRPPSRPRPRPPAVRR